MRTEISFVEAVVNDKSGLSVSDARLLFWSMALSVALFIIGRRRSEMARKDIDKLIHQTLKKANLDRLGNEGNLFRRLIHIDREVDPVSRKNSSPYIIERLISEYRVARYSEILHFTLGDADKVEEYEAQFNRMRPAEIGVNHSSWKYGISAAGVAALSYGLYQLFKKPKSSDENVKLDEK